MKTKITVCRLFVSLLALAAFFSCNNPVGLGDRLDVEGPLLTIESPLQRQSVKVLFIMEGTAWDYSGVDTLLISAVVDNTPFQRQWRYLKNAWQISDDSGATWSPFGNVVLNVNGADKTAVWDSDGKSVIWSLPVDMEIPGQPLVEGEYTFSVQAWDKGGFTDDNSLKAVVLIVDSDPPKVSVSTPTLYSQDAYTNPENPEYADFLKFRNMKGDSGEWKNTALLGKFITQDFDLKWQIDDSNDVWSIDLRFYTDDVEIDNDYETGLPDNYIYRYYQNTPPPPVNANPNDYVRLSGSVTVPELYGPAGFIEGGGELKNPIPAKTTVKVVALCYDAVGHPNQEKTLGYFISWPEANSPWIVFPEGMEGPEGLYGKPVSQNEPGYITDDEVYTVYPSRSIKATAFQSSGVKNVKYSLYQVNTSGNKLNRPDGAHPLKHIEDKDIPNEEGKTFSTIFSWELTVPVFTGFYILEAEAFTSQDKASEKYTMLFKVQDIAFPNFTDGPFPAATDPLFMAIKNNKIIISGKVSDATEIASLYMAWINPRSEGFAAMSQLSYFRNGNYAGWQDAANRAPKGGSILEAANIDSFGTGYPYDPAYPNRLWNIDFKPANPPIDNETNRYQFDFSQEIDITEHLGIGPDAWQSPLKSQVFLFRVQNPDGKSTVITYAPQGDTLAPVISISELVLKNGPNPPENFEPNTFKVIPQFSDGDTITINGTWWEDSAAYLNIEQYFLRNFKVTVNNQPLPSFTSANINRASDRSPQGTWTITVTVGDGAGQLPKDKLRDSLVIGVEARDIGGNEVEIGSSWLIQSDNLRFMRISSEEEDGIYKAGGDPIEIFLEFSRPVKLANAGLKPELILNSHTGTNARAVYKDGQESYNSRQYFVYTVEAGHHTNGSNLNVKGLWHNGTVFTASTPYNTANYPFVWYRQSDSEYEEVRITMQPNNKGDLKPNGYFVRTLPTAANNTDSDFQFTLAAGKHIKIDTTPPTVTSVTAASSAGHYRSGDIYITVNFSKPVTIPTVPGTVTPRLALNVTGGGDPTTDADNVRVNGNAITFMYKIKDGDTTNGNQVRVTGFSGDITDLAGNDLNGAMSGTLSGIYIDTIPLTDPPAVRVLSASNIGNVIGTSGTTPVALSTLYNTNLWFAITRGDPSGGSHRLDRFEYSINGGTSWITANRSTDNNPAAWPSTAGGTYTITARQITQSGFVSPASQNITLYWDPGDFITRISTTSANGTYTNTEGNGGDRKDTIPITVTFRKGVKFSAAPSITLNTNPAATITATGSFPNTSTVTELTFSYTVRQTDNTPSGQNLNVTAFNLNGGTAQDELNVNVNSFLTINNLPSASNLGNLKSIKIQTGALTSSTPAGTFTDSQVSPNGIQSDGSYNTALVIVFNRDIVRGSGEITIIQRTDGYRLPAVLTESQFNKYSGLSNADKYYMRGSNGYLNGKPDTSTKYILRYDVNTAATANAPNASGTEIQKLAEAFRQQESVKLSINAGAVKINGAQLIVELTGTNALQVPGATYAVSYPKGFVQDSLNTPCPALGTLEAPVNMGQALGGVAKPFIRINKTQDTISVNANPSATQPRLVATQPFQAEARMDCRTPSSTINYFTTNAATTTNGMNWTYNANPASNGPNDRNDAAPARPSDPQTTTANRLTYDNVIPIGTNDYQGLQWYVRAKARNSSTGSVWSADSEEMAFKTVITYVINSMPGTDTNPTDNGIGPASGDQIWIRGGDAIGLSSVPGFPLNWDVDEFERAKSENRRAGIRLFTMEPGTVGSSLANSSRWRFITWEINVDTYFDIILGRDGGTTASTAAEATQYGPRQFAYQRAGWTSYKEQFRALPGKHRWLVSDNPSGNSNGGTGKGTLNFSSTFGARRSFASEVTFPPAP